MKKQQREGFTESFKIFVVEEVELGRINKSEASRKYGILGHSTISKWCKKYSKRSRMSRKKGKMVVMAQRDQEQLRLNNEIKALKEELEDARLKNVVLETLVDIAEKEFEIPIRKKYGAKQSGR